MRRQNKLSNRELEYLRLALLPRRDIARRLCVNVTTVNTQLANIRKFYNVNSTQLSVFVAIKEGDVRFSDVEVPERN